MLSKRWLFAAAVLWLPMIAPAQDTPATQATDAATTKIVLIGQVNTGAFGQNAYLADAKLLALCLERTSGIKTIVSDGWPTDEKAFDDAKAVVLLVENGGKMLFDPKHEAKAAELMGKGVGLIAIHQAVIADLDVGERYQKWLGGYANRQFSANLTQNVFLKVMEHPAAAGLKDVSLREHYYLKLKLLPEIKPVLKTKVYNHDLDIAWAYERPEGGRSFAFVGGRYHDSYKNETLRRALVNGILWSAGVKLPENGAPVDVKPEELVIQLEKRTPERPEDQVWAEIVTPKGQIFLQLYVDKTPLTCASFINLANRKYYDGLTWHRVIPDFMIQGGCPKGDGTGDPGYKFEDEIVEELKHDSSGILSMANSGPATNGSQFFITHKPTPHLNGKHTIFGKVIGKADQQVVDSIEKDDKIESIRILGDTSKLMEELAERVTKWNEILDPKTAETETPEESEESGDAGVQ